jgi:hypothetical protein
MSPLGSEERNKQDIDDILAELLFEDETPIVETHLTPEAELNN